MSLFQRLKALFTKSEQTKEVVVVKEIDVTPCPCKATIKEKAPKKPKVTSPKAPKKIYNEKKRK